MILFLSLLRFAWQHYQYTFTNSVASYKKHMSYYHVHYSICAWLFEWIISLSNNIPKGKHQFPFLIQVHKKLLKWNHFLIFIQMLSPILNTFNSIWFLEDHLKILQIWLPDTDCSRVSWCHLMAVSALLLKGGKDYKQAYLLITIIF